MFDIGSSLDVDFLSQSKPGGAIIPKYLIQAVYTATGTKGLLKDGGSRRKTAVNILMKELGGSVEAFYYSFGESDVVVIVDLPNNVAAAALSLAVAASGRLTLKTTPLLDPAEIDEATKKTAKYSPPGADRRNSCECSWTRKHLIADCRNFPTAAASTRVSR